jgi:hypothetical protein
MIDISSPFENMYFRIVDDPIGLMALDVLVRILDPSHAQNDDQGKDDQARRDGSELRDELEDGNEGEKYISDPAVLL